MIRQFTLQPIAGDAVLQLPRTGKPYLLHGIYFGFTEGNALATKVPVLIAGWGGVTAIARIPAAPMAASVTSEVTFTGRTSFAQTDATSTGILSVAPTFSFPITEQMTIELQFLNGSSQDITTEIGVLIEDL